ncbi:hypothetical protein [Actinomadura sp. K4S16]|uniref:hypothetical protein n=1 Tax=Actinomadura sp. K4S16 TaxID=1316147 RepID=UPI0011EE4886|nr:hypothetical protein [Actinomadura sp. K4S16]
MQPLKNAELAELPTVVDINTAARALDLSRTYAYQLVRAALGCAENGLSKRPGRGMVVLGHDLN